jgi:TPR repeat protein
VLEWRGRIAAGDRGGRSFARACAQGMPAGCANVAIVRNSAGTPVQGSPQVFDYPILLRVKRQVVEVEPMDLWARACREGWSSGCEDLGGAYLQGLVTARNPSQAAAFFERACTMGRGTACSNLGLMHYQADGLPRDEATGLRYLEKACALGFQEACHWRKDIVRPPS